MKDNKIQKSIYDSEKLIEWGGFLNEFLWVCAGADRKVLRQCPTDYAKYAGIGGTILFTALMAMLSGGYALYTVFDNGYTALGFGFFWGLLIFNLDRFIVNTMYSDGKVTISWKELVAGMPRIIIAIFLGIVISTPLELKIFEDEINVVIKERIQERVRQYNAEAKAEIEFMQSRVDSLAKRKDELRNSPLDLHIENLTNDASINSLIAEKKTKKAEWDRHEESIKSLELERRRYLAKKTQQDSIRANAKNSEKWKHIQQRGTLAQEIKIIDAKLGGLSEANTELMRKAQSQRDSDIVRYERDIDKRKIEIQNAKEKLVNDPFAVVIKEEYGGFQARMDAFSAMKDSNESTRVSSIFIMLLFVIIETAPTFFKMMIASGPYDDLLRAEMHRVRVLSEKRISDINDEVNTAVQITVEKNKGRLEAELAANKLVMDKLSTAQAELLQRAIEDWRKEEMEKVIANPSAYVQGSNKSGHVSLSSHSS